MNPLLKSAIDTYRQVRNEIASIDDARELRPSEKSMRQIGLFGEADTLCDLGPYAESADAYKRIHHAGRMSHRLLILYYLPTFRYAG